MKITTLGVVFTLKNIGGYLASYTIAGIKTNPDQFAYALFIYCLINVPTDLFMLNHITKKGENPNE